MALRHSAFYSPFLMLMAGGFLRAEGLEPHYSLPTVKQNIAECIYDGRCHVAQSAVATHFAGLERGESSAIKHFAQINACDGFFIVARQATNHFNWRQLEGRRILADHFFQPLAMLKYGLHRQGVNFSRLDVIDAGEVPAMIDAFRHGVGDYIHLQGPAPQQLEQDGVGAVVAAVADAVGPVAFSSLCAHENWLDTEMALAFMRAYQKSLDYVITAPAEEIAARSMEAEFFPNISLEVLQHTIMAYQQLGCWRRSPLITQADYASLVEVFIFNGAISRRYAYNEVIALPPGYSGAV